MTPKTFLDNLRHVVDAPEGVQRLREMVLNLGVTGRLSKPRDGDTPGLICLQRCRRHYDNLVANGMMRSQPSPMDDGGSGSFGVIPPTWIWCTLGDVTSYGFTQKAEFSDVEPTTWVLELEDIEKGTSKIETKVRASERRFRSTKNRFARGQVLYGKLRPYLDKVVVADEAGVCTTEIMPILAFDGVEPEYLKVFLKSPTFRSYATNSTHGMNLPRLGTEAARAARFPLPPLEEQKRIVAKVDELMRLCDRLEAQQQERETLLPLLSRANHARFVTEPEKVNLRAIFHAPGAVSPDDLRSTICSLAVSGRLVSRQSEEDVAQALSKYNIAPILPIDAPSLPEHWKWVRLGDVATTMNSGWSPACQPKPANPDQWGVLTTTAVQALEYLENENKVLPLNLKPRPEAEVQHGDILLTRAGPKNRVGIICVARPTRPRLMISDKIIRLHLITDIVPDFGALVLNTGHTSACIENLKSGMAASQMNISQPKLKSVPIPVPPKEEQLRILERVSQLLALVRKLAEQKLKQRLTSESFAKAAVAAITSTEFTESERMKPPRTEVVTALTPGRKPKNAALAPLAELLTFEIHLGVPKHGANSGTDGSLTAKELWRISELDIAQFYQQLKTEMANGWITEAKKAIVKEVEAR